MSNHLTLLRISKRLLASCAILIALVSSHAHGQFSPEVTPPADSLKLGFDSITTDQAKAWLGVLAGPEFEGRGTGQVGYTKAAHWVGGKLAEFGLEPIGTDGTYFQMLPMQRRKLVLQDCWLSGPDGLKIKAVGNLGFERFTDKQESTGEIVFVNFSDPSKRFPEELSLREKIVIYVASPDVKSAPVQLARKRPLAAIRVIEGEPNSISQLVRSRGRRNTSISGTITLSAAEKLAEAMGVKKSVVALSTMPQDTIVAATEKDVTLRLRYREESAAVPNVVGWLEGTDPKLKNEYVVIGSHLDHLGIRGGQVYPGADDNGSGSTAVLSIAKAMAMNPVKPKRSVLFIWFAAEEIGLIGSKHYCDNPTKPVEDMICMFNIDMVGRNEETKDETAEENEGHIHLVGSQKGDTDLHGLIAEANKSIGFEFEFDEEKRVFSRSDQINFFRLGVPVAFLFGGFHPDYHQPSDLHAKINFKKITSAAKLYYLAIHLASEHGRFELKTESSN
jgi:hypothetical protein